MPSLPLRIETSGRKRALKGRSVADKRGPKPERADKRRPKAGACCAARSAALAAGVFEDFEDFFYEGFPFVRGEVAGVDGLFVGLEVAQACLFGPVLVYEADYGVNLLAGQSVAAAGQSAPHAGRSFRDDAWCRGRLYRWDRLSGL